MKSYVYLFGFILVLLLIGACKKYPEGPQISLLPRTERIEGKWVATSVKFNEIDSSEQYKGHIWEFTRNNSVILQVGTTKTTGIWSTVTNDNDFVIDYDNGVKEQYEIRKMMRTEFWIRNKKTQLDFHLKLK
jgi:hypothetical protein